MDRVIGFAVKELEQTEKIPLNKVQIRPPWPLHHGTPTRKSGGEDKVGGGGGGGG